MSEVKRYKIDVEGYEEEDDNGRFVLHSDYEQKVSALTSRIASLEREKEEARDKALEDAVKKLRRERIPKPLGFAAIHNTAVEICIRALKGEKP